MCGFRSSLGGTQDTSGQIFWLECPGQACRPCGNQQRGEDDEVSCLAVIDPLLIHVLFLGNPPEKKCILDALNAKGSRTLPPRIFEGLALWEEHMRLFAQKDAMTSLLGCCITLETTSETTTVNAHCPKVHWIFKVAMATDGCNAIKSPILCSKAHGSLLIQERLLGKAHPSSICNDPRILWGDHVLVTPWGVELPWVETKVCITEKASNHTQQQGHGRAGSQAHLKSTLRPKTAGHGGDHTTKGEHEHNLGMSEERPVVNTKRQEVHHRGTEYQHLRVRKMGQTEPLTFLLESIFCSFERKAAIVLLVRISPRGCSLVVPAGTLHFQQTAPPQCQRHSAA